MLTKNLWKGHSMLFKPLKKLVTLLRATSSRAPPLLLNSQLPLELVLEILCHLEAFSLLKCRMICRQLRLLVDTTPELRYTVELAMSSFADNARDLLTPLVQRLTLLQELQMFWKKPRFRPGQSISFEPNNFSYHGNIFVMPRRTRNLGDTRLCNTLGCIALEPDGIDIVAREWTLDLQFDFESFSLDPPRSTLVLLRWIRRSGSTQAHNEWIHAVNVVSLHDGQPISGGLMHTPAPRRDFEESPSLTLQDNMLYVIAGGLHGDVSDQSRNLYVTVINILTGMVHAQLTRRYEHGLEYNSKSLVFASPTFFLLAVKQERYFSVELYSLEDDVTMDTQGVIIPMHIATYQFPSLEKGTSSTGAWNAITISHSAGLARQHDPHPFIPDLESTIINFNRLYYCPTDSIRISCYVHLATFLSALKLYRNREINTGSLVLPWNAWGPTHTRCFDDSRSGPLHILSRAAYGSRVYEYSWIRDYNQREIARDLGTGTSHSMHPVTRNPRINSHLPFSRSSRDHSAAPKEDRKVHDYPGRIVLRPTVIPAGNIFIEDVMTMLPYRETEIIWEEEQPRVVLGGEVWVGGFRRENTDEPGNTSLVYRSLIPCR